jgi:hypothetical protein
MCARVVPIHIVVSCVKALTSLDAYQSKIAFYATHIAASDLLCEPGGKSSLTRDLITNVRSGLHQLTNRSI